MTSRPSDSNEKTKRADHRGAPLQHFRRIICACLVSAVTFGAESALAQAYPSKAVRMIAPFAAGGASDIAARAIAAALSDSMGQQVVVDNRPGVGGVIGVDLAARAPADGYTFVFGSSTTVAANIFLYKEVKFDPLKDFEPLAMLGTISFGILVPAKSPYKSLSGLLAAAKARPGALSYGSGSSAALLCGEIFKSAAEVDLLKIPYKGTPQALTDLLGGRLDVLCEPIGTALPFLEAGSVRALAVTGPTRNPLASSVPTLNEIGVPMQHYTWAAFFAPVNVPKDIAAKLSVELLKAMKRPEVVEKIKIAGFEPTPLPADQLAKVHLAEFEKIKKVVQKAGIRPE